MKTVKVQAEVDPERCSGCRNCQFVCPVHAITVHRVEGNPRVDIDLDMCVGCWNCEQRCPEYAIAMKPCEPFDLAVDVGRFDSARIEELCRRAHFHPKQIMCYCTGSRAEEIAAAILDGAESPSQVVRACGVGAGCGIECNQTILRFLEAAGKSLERPKLSHQWYGRTPTAWDVPEALKRRYPNFRFDSDRELLTRISQAPVKK